MRPATILTISALACYVGLIGAAFIGVGWMGAFVALGILGFATFFAVVVWMGIE